MYTRMQSITTDEQRPFKPVAGYHVIIEAANSVGLYNYMLNWSD